MKLFECNALNISNPTRSKRKIGTTTKWRSAAVVAQSCSVAAKNYRTNIYVFKQKKEMWQVYSFMMLVILLRDSYCNNPVPIYKSF